MSSYNAGDIVGKTLTANVPIPLKRLPMDSAPTIFTVGVNQPVGVVDSFISPGPDNKNLYWKFLDNKNKSYYAEHKAGNYSLSGIKDQGIKTTQEKTSEAEKADEPLKNFIAKNMMKIVGIAAGAFLLSKIIPEIIKKK